MKKSKKYFHAMIAVVDDSCLEPEEKLEIIEMLMADKKMAEYCEEHEGEA